MALKLRMPDGTWQDAGTPTKPLRLRMPNGTWMLFGGGGGVPLNVRRGDSKWELATTGGSSAGHIHGRFFEFNQTLTSEINLTGRTLQIFQQSSPAPYHSYNILTDANGEFDIPVPVLPNRVFIRAFKAVGYDYVDIDFILSSQDPLRENVEIGIPETFQITEYPFNTNVFNAFHADTGWTVNRRTAVEWWWPYDVSWSDRKPSPLTTADDPRFATGIEDTSSPSSFFMASTRTESGYIGEWGEFILYARRIDENVGWMSVPVGMFIDEAKTQFELQRINGAEWTKFNAQMVRIEVIHHLYGCSVSKSRTSLFSDYYGYLTTDGLWPGVGAVRYQGPTPTTTEITVPFKTGVYTLPAIRDKAFNREEGDIVWVGNLNDLGSPGRHVNYFRAPVQIVQTFTPDLYEPEDSLQYHIQTSPLPEPDRSGYDDYDGWAKENYMYDEISVKVYYQWH